MSCGFSNGVLNANNVDFRQTGQPSAQVLLDGQLLIGSSVAPHIQVATLTAGSNVTITNGHGAITIAATGGPALPVTVPNGGTGITTTTAYSVICAGTTATGAFQSLAALGSSGTVLTSNGASALPSFQAAAPPATYGFAATSYTNQNNVTGAGEQAVMICDHVYFDTTSGYNSGTGVFTAPIAGKYQFNYCMCINGIGAAHTTLRAYSYGGHGGGTYTCVNPSLITDVNAGFFSTSGSFVSKMSQGDQMVINLAVYGGTQIVGIQSDNQGLEQTSFSGFFIGA